MSRDGANDERTAIRFLTGNGTHAARAAGTRPVLDDHGAEVALNRVRENAGRDIQGTARGPRHHDRNRALAESESSLGNG